MKNKTLIILLVGFLLALDGSSARSGVSAKNNSVKPTSSFSQSVSVLQNSFVVETSAMATEPHAEAIQEDAVAIVEEVKRLSNEEIAAAVLRGEYGNGSERIAKIESMGYNYDDIQKAVNELTPKAPTPAPDTKPTTPKASVPTSEYKANTVYIKSTAMPFKVSNYDKQAADIDSTWKTWVTSGSYPNWKPNDNRGTFFAQHNNRGGDVLFKLNYGDTIIVTDGNKTPYKYVVDKIIRHNMAEYFDAELSGDLEKEYLIFQTCEYGDGTIHVLATRKSE